MVSHSSTSTVQLAGKQELLQIMGSVMLKKDLYDLTSGKQEAKPIQKAPTPHQLPFFFYRIIVTRIVLCREWRKRRLCWKTGIPNIKKTEGRMKTKREILGQLHPASWWLKNASNQCPQSCHSISIAERRAGLDCVSERSSFLSARIFINNTCIVISSAQTPRIKTTTTST